MKKQYIKPQVEIVRLDIHHMLAASPPGYGGEGGSRELRFPDDWEWE